MISVYIIIIILLCIGTYICTFKFNDKLKKYIFNVCFFLTSIILILRYGQGTDYFAYNYIYDSIGNCTSLDSVLNLHVHSEKLWNIINYLFQQINFSFEAFNVALSIIFSLSLYYFIKTYVRKNQLLALSLSISYVYLTYFMSGLRQGLVISIFITILLYLYNTKKFKIFIIVTLLCTGIHRSSLVFLLLLVIPYIKGKHWNYIYLLSFALSLIFIIYNNISIINLIENSLLQFLERFIFFVIIIYLYNNTSNVIKKEYNDLFIIYILGFLIYMIFIYNPLISARVSVYFRLTEIILIPNLLAKSKIELINKICIQYALVLILLFLSLKSLNANIEQGEYYSKNLMDYPYVSIFNKADIYKYRDSRFFKILKE